MTIYAGSLAVSLLAGCASTQPQSTQTALAAGAGCAQLDDDAALEQFYRPGAVYDAKPVEEKIFRARAIQPTMTVGASLYVRAEPAMNAPYMRRVLACHAASGQEAHANDPLFPSNGTIASLNVREVTHGFVVDVVADEPKVGKEIWQRAESFSQRSGNVNIEQVSSAPDSNAVF